MKRKIYFLSLILTAFVILFAACEPEEPTAPSEPDTEIPDAGTPENPDTENPDTEKPSPEEPSPDVPGPEPSVLTFSIELSQIGINSVNMKVTPSDDEAIYVYDVIQKTALDEHHEGSIATYVGNLVASVMEEYPTPEAVLERIGTIGAASYSYRTLSPDTEYVAFAIAVSMDCEPVGEAEIEAFTTLPMPEVCTWEVTFDEYFYDGVSFTVTPSDDTVPYYFTVRPSVAYGDVMDDEELLKAILMEDGMMLDFYATTGVYESKYDDGEFILCSDTGYDLLIFGYSDGAPLTSIKKYPFRSLKPDAEDPTFDISVSTTTEATQILITPSDEHTMYMWDVVDKSDLDGDYNGDIEAYVKAYIADMIKNQGLYELDFSRIMGNDTYTFRSELQPGTEYVVWASWINEYGAVVGEIDTETFTIPSSALALE